jgi:predicted Rossmann fold flavoprotein
MAEQIDVLIMGAGAAGMMCAFTAASRGRSVVLLDHAEQPGEKIRISGGGHCNFTNLNVKQEHYLSHNPHFCRSALARFSPQHFIALLQKHRIGFHEKTQGQLFCDAGSELIVEMLKTECDEAGVRWCLGAEVQEIEPHACSDLQLGEAEKVPVQGFYFKLSTTQGRFNVRSLVIATGGLSIPKTGATPLGYKVAQQFGVAVTKLKPGLVPLSFHPEEWSAYSALAGISLDAVVSCEKQSFRENLLFTHRGLSGPAILQISSYWEHAKPLSINLVPDHDMRELLLQQRGSRSLPANFLSQVLPKRFVEVWCGQFAENKPLNQYSEKQLASLAAQLHAWKITPTGTLGYNKAEVTCGGVDTRALSSKTMQANAMPGLYFIGEVIDVTGQLGGYNFQWAWASGYAAGQAV